MWYVVKTLWYNYANRVYWTDIWHKSIYNFIHICILHRKLSIFEFRFTILLRKRTEVFYNNFLIIICPRIFRIKFYWFDTRFHITVLSMGQKQILKCKRRLKWLKPEYLYLFRDFIGGIRFFLLVTWRKHHFLHSIYYH